MPLILPSQRVIRPNPLAYPAGAVPGVDRSHPAAENLILSAVASAGPNYIDVRTGAPLTNQQGAQTSAPSASIVGPLGPAVTSLSGGKALGIAFDSGRTIAAITTAAIFKFASVHQGSGYQTLIVFGGSRGMWTVNDTVTLYLGTDTISATLDFDAPHFIAASAIVNGASSPICLVLRNLKTGQTFTTITTHGNAAFSGLSNLTVGNDTSNEFSTYPVAAAMCSNVFLSPAQLLQWAQDPWSFWYPRSTIQYRTPATTTTSGGARIRQRWNRSPLAYPAGATPGIDRSHPAARNCAVAAVANPAGNYSNLVTGLLGTPGSKAIVPLVGVHGLIGPNSFFSANNSQETRFTGPNIVQPVATYGAIFNYTANAGAGIYQTIIVTSGNGNLGFWIKNDNVLFLTIGDNPSTFSLTAGQSYFVAMSGGTVSGNLISMVAKNLSTGQVQFCTISNGSTSTLQDNTVLIGNDSSLATGEFADCKIAAAMYSPTLLSMQQLLQWAADPWSFWYPNKTINLASSTASAGASFLPVWAYRYNLPVLGTGNF